MTLNSNILKLKHWTLSKFRLVPDNFEASNWTMEAGFRNLVVGLVTIRIGLIIAILWTCLSAILDHQLTICETSMFQRSGAVLVAAAALVEFGSQKNLMNWYMTSGLIDNEWCQRLMAFQSSGKMLGVIFVIVGTLIWAYGDFLFFANCK